MITVRVESDLTPLMSASILSCSIRSLGRRWPYIAESGTESGNDTSIKIYSSQRKRKKK